MPALPDSKPYIAVAGLGRCGSSLTMQMLHAGGVRCAGEWPAFECDEANHAPIDESWLRSLPEGSAVKVLDPLLTVWPANVPCLSIWTGRNLRQQARSQAKFMRIMLGARLNHRQMLLLEKVLLRDEQLSLAALPRPVLKLSFEHALLYPATHAEQLCSFLSVISPALNQSMMAGAVLPRSADCAPGMEIELRLINQGAQP